MGKSEDKQVRSKGERSLKKIVSKTERLSAPASASASASAGGKVSEAELFRRKQVAARRQTSDEVLSRYLARRRERVVRKVGLPYGGYAKLWNNARMKGEDQLVDVEENEDDDFEEYRLGVATDRLDEKAHEAIDAENTKKRRAIKHVREGYGGGEAAADDLLDRDLADRPMKVIFAHLGTSFTAEQLAFRRYGRRERR